MKKKIIPFILILIVFYSFNCKSSTNNNMYKIRKPVVAGTFYPGNKEQLKDLINKFLSQVKFDKNEILYPRALIVPHAGYIYSGAIAASGFALLKGKNYKKTFLIGPSHHVYLKKASIPQVDYYETPLGLIKLSKISKELLNEQYFEYISQAHTEEHCLEVEIPFLQVVMNETEIIPIIIGQSYINEIAESLIKKIDNDTFIIVSSDLSHYHPYNDALKLDNQCVKSILNNDFNNIYKQEACGLYPIIILMKIANHFGWKAKLLDIRNSGDTSGSKDNVVGYAAIVFYENKKKDLTLSDKDKNTLFELARTAIIKKSQNIDVSKYSISNPLLEKRGCFVTLNLNNELRGCIGYIMPVKSLYQAVIDNAFNAAYQDPRFMPVSEKEIKNLKIEISILTVPEKMNYSSKDELLNKLIPNKDGVIINKNGRSATFLPQVWEQLPAKEQFLEHLCQKAGLSSNTWKDGDMEVLIYKAFVFHE